MTMTQTNRLHRKGDRIQITCPRCGLTAMLRSRLLEGGPSTIRQLLGMGWRHFGFADSPEDHWECGNAGEVDLPVTGDVESGVDE